MNYLHACSFIWPHNTKIFTSLDQRSRAILLHDATFETNIYMWCQLIKYIAELGFRPMYVISHDRMQKFSMCDTMLWIWIYYQSYSIFMQMVIILSCFIHTISYMHSSSIWQSKLFIQSKFNSTIMFGPTVFTRWWLIQVWSKFFIHLKST